MPVNFQSLCRQRRAQSVLGEDYRLQVFAVGSKRRQQRRARRENTGFLLLAAGAVRLDICSDTHPNRHDGLPESLFPAPPPMKLKIGHIGAVWSPVLWSELDVSRGALLAALALYARREESDRAKPGTGSGNDQLFWD